MSKPMSDGGKGSVRRNEDNDAFRDNWDRIFGIKKEPKDIAEHVWNDKMKEMQRDIDLKMIKGENNE